MARAAASDLTTYVGASTEDATYVASCWTEAVALVNGLIGTATVPEEITDRAYLECGSELYHRRQAPNGIAQFATFDGSAIRVARDPLVGVYPLLSRFIGMGIG